MQTKICFKCNTNKPLSDYYTHKKMGDGHLGKCKNCTKTDSDIREKELRKNPEWVEKEKKRAREKYHRLEYRVKHKPSFESKKAACKRYSEKYPEKLLIKSKMGKTIKAKDGFNLHHWSYNRTHFLDVIELSILDHNKLHRYIVYDQERMMYRRIDTNELLDTKERHIEYFELIKNKD